MAIIFFSFGYVVCISYGQGHAPPQWWSNHQNQEMHTMHSHHLILSPCGVLPAVPVMAFILYWKGGVQNHTWRLVVWSLFSLNLERFLGLSLTFVTWAFWKTFREMSVNFRFLWHLLRIIWVVVHLWQESGAMLWWPSPRILLGHSWCPNSPLLVLSMWVMTFEHVGDEVSVKLFSSPQWL